MCIRDRDSGNLILATGSEDKNVRIWNMSSARSLRALDCMSQVWSMIALDHPAMLAVGLADGSVTVWDWKRGCVLRKLDAHLEGVGFLATLRDQCLLASSSYDGFIHIWKWKNGDRIRSFADMGEIMSISITRDGRALACVSDTPDVVIITCCVENENEEAKTAEAFTKHVAQVQQQADSPFRNCLNVLHVFL
eukprot:TRINITY_DN23888_c0_g1_i1.p1 TRINITY_DN23888_c0_g1~~TRINITY_DN23888_c0_g1_i1.p1  ORF type:complete len:219 (-),score=15.90 TRINITY_DN23888_c0_g1_i1:13-591(-)